MAHLPTCILAPIVPQVGKDPSDVITTDLATVSAVGKLEMPSHKAPKLRAESSPSNYSNDVKKKLQASNRTGQACDRCRVCFLQASWS